MIEVGSPAWAQQRGGGDRQPVPGAVPDAGTPSIDQHSNAPETWQNGRVKGLQEERDRKVQWPISLGGDGMGELPCPPPPVRCRWTISRCCGRDVRAKQRAAAGSLAL